MKNLSRFAFATLVLLAWFVGYEMGQANPAPLDTRGHLLLASMTCVSGVLAGMCIYQILLNTIGWAVGENK